MPFRFERLTIPEVVLVEPVSFSDARGFVMETFRQSEFAPFIDRPFVQENHTRSTRGTIRGLHYQRDPHGQGKLVRVVSGEIFDVAVDVRADSATRGHWVSAMLSADNRRMMYLPPWCAHGFCVMSETADVIYSMTAEYTPSHESGIRWNDPALGIAWPIASPVLSERDGRWPPFSRP